MTVFLTAGLSQRPLLALPLTLLALLLLRLLYQAQLITSEHSTWDFEPFHPVSLPLAPLTPPNGEPSCNPYLKPGVLALNRTLPHLSSYKPFDPTCQPNNTLLHFLASGQPVPEFRGKTLLVIGDSVDRGVVTWMCGLAGRKGAMRMSQLNDSQIPRPRNENNGNPRTCTLPSLDFQLHFYHFCGLSNDHLWADKGRTCNPPGDFLARWKQFGLWAGSLEKQPDLVVMQSAIWDLAAFDRNLYLHMDTDTDLPGFTDGWLDRWVGDMLEMTRRVKELFPGVPIHYRTMHQVQSEGGRWFKPPGAYNTSHGSAFRPLRIQQLVQAQRYVIQEQGLGVMPYGELVVGEQGLLKDDIHPNDVGAALIAEMMLEALWRQGRGQ